MRAILFDRYGGPEVLYEGQLPLPAVDDGAVLVRVDASSVNGADLLLRSGKLALLGNRKFPKTLGIDFVGTLVGASPSASLEGLAIGDRVWGTVDERGGMRALAEFVSVPAAQISRAPKNLAPEEAVTILAGATTAHSGLMEKARLQRGERVLVRGAAGGVGSIAVQLAKRQGAHVTALASSAGMDFARDLGADVVVDYREAGREDLGDFDVVFDTPGSDLRAFRKLLAPRGRMVTIAFDMTAPVRSLLGIATSVTFGRRRIRFLREKPTRTDFERVTAQVERGDLRPVLDHVFPVSLAADAHALLEARGVRGKVAISFQE